MAEREPFEVDVDEESPPEILDHLIDELVDFNAEREEDMEAEWIPEEGLFRVHWGQEDPVDVLLVDIDAEAYGESEAVVVEAEVCPLREGVDLARVMRFADEELVYGRLALAADEEGGELVVLQAATPVHLLTAPQLDRMIHEVAVLSRELREDLQSNGA